MSPQDQQECAAATVAVLTSVAMTRFTDSPSSSLIFEAGLLGQECPSYINLARERCAAAAGLLRIGVHENESLLHQGLVVVQRHSVQIDKRFRIYKDPNIAELKNAVTFARLRIEANVVTQTRASAALHAYAQPTLVRRHAFLGHRRANLANRLLGDLN